MKCSGRWMSERRKGVLVVAVAAAILKAHVA